MTSDDTLRTLLAELHRRHAYLIAAMERGAKFTDTWQAYRIRADECALVITKIGRLRSA